MKVIEQEIAALKNTINEMWALVHQQIYNAGEAMLTGDKELAYKVLSRERRVNAFELKIDSDCEDIIALYAPVAIDLRFVLAMYKVNTKPGTPRRLRQKVSHASPSTCRKENRSIRNW